MPSLSSLFSYYPFPIQSRLPEVEISAVVSDSRQVRPGALFVALSGGSADGHSYIPNAIEHGAAAIVGVRVMAGLPVPYVRVEDSRPALAYLAAAFYGRPAHAMTMIGVTGTDGKTTTTNLVYSLLQAAGLRVGMISTVNAQIGNLALDTGFHVTTPDAPEVQRYLAQMASAGLKVAVLEATSHGLAQFRVEACEFDLAAVTNITHEHLDYHFTYEAYRDAKRRLFDMLSETPPKDLGGPRLGVLNRDDSSYDYLHSHLRVAELSYGLHPQAQVRAEAIDIRPDGLSFTAVGPGFRFPVESHLTGLFNVSNILAAISLSAVGLDLPVDTVQAGIASFAGVPGRMERLELGQDFMALVDFAHTPNALQAALEAARLMLGSQPHPGRVIAVFGAAGLRDRQKRRLMAGVSTRYSDLSVLTAEDPRTEALDDILAEMAAGAVEAGGVEGQTFWRVPDRSQALRFAVSLARPGDLVIACGKGHEQSMCFGETEYPWDDRTALRAALCEKLGIHGPAMPRLPTSPLDPHRG